MAWRHRTQTDKKQSVTTYYATLVDVAFFFDDSPGQVRKFRVGGDVGNGGSTSTEEPSSKTT
eukprot:5318354-Amphidinium_carterae.1